MLFRLTLFLSLASVLTLPGRAASFTVEGAAAHARQHNPSLAAARLRIDEARGRFEQSGRFSNPELELNAARNFNGREGAAGVALLQRLPITARLRYQKAVSRAELAAAEAEVRDAERLVVADVRTAAVRLLALASQRELRTRQLANTRELFTFLTRRVEAGEASAVDAAQVELETRQLELEDLQLAAGEATLAGELRPLLGLASSEGLKITGELAVPREAASRAGSEERPDLLAARSRAEAAQSLVLEQRARRWGDVELGVSYLRDRIDDAPEPLETEQIVGFRFSLPLPLWDNSSGRIREAQAAAARAAAEVETVRITATNETSAAAVTMESFARVIRALDDKILPTALRIEEQLRTNYSTGQTALIDVLRARTRRLELERQRLDALRDYHLARVRYFAATARF